MLLLVAASHGLLVGSPVCTMHRPCSVHMNGGKGFGGGEATRDPEPTAVDPSDPKGKQQAIHKAESFADYLARRNGGATPASAVAPAAAAAAPAGTEVETVIAWQPAALSKVAEALQLTPKEDYAADCGYDAFSIGDAAGSITSFEGPGAPNVAWCSGLLLKGGDTARSALTAFCGPLTDVPHLVASAGVSDGGIDLYIDWRPRADAAYDPAFATLENYPEPTDRNMFAQGSNRKDFAAAFYTEDAAAWRAELLALDGASANEPLSAAAMATLSGGPLLIDMRLPLTEAAAAAASDACAAAVDRWLGWMTSAGEMKRELAAGAKQTATYARDTKVRANHYGFLLKRYTAAYGEAVGASLAAADAGPLDEAYVGGAS